MKSSAIFHHAVPNRTLCVGLLVAKVVVGHRAGPSRGVQRSVVAPDLKPSLFPFQEPIDIRQVLGAGDAVIKRLAVFASRPNRFGRLKSEIPKSA